MFRIPILLACVVTLLSSASAQAQGLLWNLPADGSFVEIEGNYSQTIFRPKSSKGNLELSWLRQMTISSVGEEQAEYKGTMQPCRWIEIKLQTGGASADGVNTGSVGERIYLVLVPEAEIRGSVSDSEGLPVSYIPIVEGYRKTNERDLTAKPIQSKMLQIYPVISLIRHYNKMQESDLEQTVQVGANDYVVKEMTGDLVQESPTRRFRHETRLLRGDDVPFGLAEWEVKIAEERKADVETRDKFQQVSELTVQMKVVRVQMTGAKSELRSIIEKN